MSHFFSIPFVFLCLLLQGFFSGSEIALVQSDRYKLRTKAESGNRGARIAYFLISTPSLFFSVVLLGTNLCVVSATVVVTLIMIKAYGIGYSALAVLYGPVSLVFGEILPKAVYQRHADRLAIKVAPFLMLFYYLFFPFVWLLRGFTNLLFKNISSESKPRVTREDLETMVKIEPEAGDIKKSEIKMVSRIFDLSDKRVENIMTPLIDVVALPVTASKDEAVKAFLETEYSRLPVFQDRIYNVIGFLRSYDLFFKRSEISLSDMIRPIIYVPEYMPLDELYHRMKQTHLHIAVAVDEYGAATGLVTDEDLCEEVVGEIRDEHDEEMFFARMLGKNHFLVSGRLEVEKANSRFKLNIPLGDYETIAGYLLHKLEHIPKPGKKITDGNLTFIVRRASKKAILEVEVIKK